MGMVLEVEVQQEVFQRRIQPFGVALAEVSWRVKMFTHDGVVLAAVRLEEPNLVIALSFWPYQHVARRLFKANFELSLYSPEIPPGRVRFDVQLDAAMVEELFVAAALINPRPRRANARRAEQYFAHFLEVSFPEAVVVWSRTHHWRKEIQGRSTRMPMRVG